MSNIHDEDFSAFAAEFEKEENARRERRGTGNFERNYETIKWSGLEPNRMKIVRVLGGVPNSPNADKFTARITQVAWIRGDDGKPFRCVLPPKETGGEHIMWRVIKRVNEVAYIQRKRVFVNETKYPDIYNLVNFNGLKEEDPKRKFDRGWEGRNVIVMNVIDREQMDWHREQKHTMLLSRNIGRSADGTREYAEEGVPVYGFFNVIATSLFKHYGNWENYDIGIVRLGTTQTPYRLVNATAYAAAGLPEFPKELIPLVSAKPLTEEESSWTRYDLDKLFGTTSYTKLYNKLQVAFRTIDARLGTSFFKELEFEYEKEKAERAAKAESFDPEKLEEAPAPKAVVAPEMPKAPESTKAAPTRTAKPIPATAATTLTEEQVAALKGWQSLTADQRAAIVSVKLKDGNVQGVTYNSEENQFGCPQCQIPAPEDFQTCPACGLSFT